MIYVRIHKMLKLKKITSSLNFDMPLSLSGQKTPHTRIYFYKNILESKYCFFL